MSMYVSVFPADVQQMLVIKEEELHWIPSMDQQNPDHFHIKEELWNSMEGEQLNFLEEAGSTRFTLAAVSVKYEEDEQKPQIMQLYQRQAEDNAEQPTSSSASQITTEADEEDCKVSGNSGRKF